MHRGEYLQSSEAVKSLKHNVSRNDLVEVSIGAWVPKNLMKLYVDCCEELPEQPNMKVLKKLYSLEVSEDKVIITDCDLHDISVAPLLAALHAKMISVLDLSHNALGNGTMERLRQLFLSSGQNYGGLVLDLHSNRLGPSAALFQINTCNGFYCDQFTPNSIKTPKMWTENWSGWFLPFGGAVPYRPVEDLAFAVARFFQLGGTFQNYYMYHGGTNFDRSSGGPFIATSYDYDAPIDEYGLLRQPKWGHLKDLHKAIKLCEEAMVATNPTSTSLGSKLEVYQTSRIISFLVVAFIGSILMSCKPENLSN